MVKQIEREVAYYYDANPTEEDLVSESTVHERVVQYLMEVLQWHLRDQDSTVYGNLGFYHTSKHGEKPLAPDIAVVKGRVFQAVRSWKIGTTGPAPQVVVEIGSEETWDTDLSEKPAKYAGMGTEEYFAYDPNEQLLKKGTTRRLYGWQLDTATGRMEPMPVGADGCLWSPLLESFLVPDGPYLRLHDRDGYLRLTEAQAESRRADAETQAKLAEARRADEEKHRADAETQAKLAETRRADEEKRRADAETQAKLAEARRADALAEKLRSLGIDPNQI